MSKLKTALKLLLALLILFVAASLLAIWYLGAWNILFPSTSYETEPPPVPPSLTSPAVLLFTKTNGFRHAEGIEAGVRLFNALGEKNGWSMFHTENSAIFNAEDLARFDVVVFHNTTGNALSSDQREALKNSLESGGSWLGVHAAADGSHAYWPWYMQNLIGVEFTAHIMSPQFQAATVHNEAPDHPVMQGLPVQWSHTEEWYSWKASPRGKGFEILATIDEDSYNPVQKMLGRERDLRMGDHPIAWYRCVGDGRALYSTMGHSAEAYEAPEHRTLLENALDWLLQDGACGD